MAMAAIKIDDLDALITKGRELKQLLQSSPEIAAFADGLRQSREPVLLMEHDRLVRAGEAASILGVNKSTIGKYVNDGLLTAYFTPGSTSRKFRISELWKIPKEAHQ
jgi:excisionase family DNA binding protein